MMVVLPAPLWPNKPDYFALPDREVDPIDGEKIPVPTRQLFRFDHSLSPVSDANRNRCASVLSLRTNSRRDFEF